MKCWLVKDGIPIFFGDNPQEILESIPEIINRHGKLAAQMVRSSPEWFCLVAGILMIFQPVDPVALDGSVPTVSHSDRDGDVYPELDGCCSM